LCSFSETQKQQKQGTGIYGILLIGLFWKMHKNTTKCNKTQRKWCINKHGASKIIDTCGDPGLPPGIPVMHTIHDPRKTVMNPHNRVGITEYIIHYINKSISLTWPLGRIQMPHRASSLSIAAESKVASAARVVPLPYRRLTGRRILVCTSVVELLTIIIEVIIII
jgi:hypothetical protein